MKKLIALLLAWLATAIRRKYNPRIVAITGSVGKTTTKQAIVTVLKGSFSLRSSDKNFNNEFGLPLTIIGVDSPGRNPRGWIEVILKALSLLWTTQDYPQLLVLEMGADKPGDIKYLTNIAPPDVAVLTSLGISHVANFGSPTEIVREKSQIFLNRKPGGVALFNADDHACMTILGRAAQPVMTYGFSAEADIRGTNFSLRESRGVWGISFSVDIDNEVAVPVFIPGALSQEQGLSSLAALAVAYHLRIPLTTAVQRLKGFQAPKGRLRLLPGQHGSLLIDDTYNAAPQSVKAALRVAHNLAQTKKLPLWVALGDMLELGDYERSSHEEIGRYLREISVDILVTAGARAEHIAGSAQNAGMRQDMIFSFRNSVDAAAWITRKMSHPCIVLIKGSQGARMELMTKALLADQSQAATELVRQDKAWKL